MIFTNLDDDKKNKTLHEKFQKCIEYVNNNDILKMETGVYDIEDGIKLSYSVYNPKDITEGFWEGHIKYIDIQIMLDGEEYIYVNNIKNMEKISEDMKNDLICFKGSELFKVPLKSREVIILYPSDIHMPGIKTEKSGSNKKAVFKIDLNKM